MVSHKVFLVGCFIFLLATWASAQSDIALADILYEEAQKLYEQGNCKNASEKVERAYNLYSKHNNIPGMNKCNDLDGQIDTCLRNQGYNKYQEAGKRLRNQEYDAAKAFALEAKELFSLIPDEEWVSKCEERIQVIGKEIDKYLESMGDDYYGEAMDFYGKSDYLTALEKAKTAKEFYSKIPSSEGVQKCETLIENINIDMKQTKEKANLYYTYAEEWYTKAQTNPTFKNFNTAMGYAENASRLYSLVNDTAGYASAQDLLNFLKEELARNEERLNNEAKSYYNTAEQEYLEGRRYFHEEEYSLAYQLFNNASSHSKYAKATYTELYEWSKDLIDPQQRKRKKDFYSQKIRECQEQLKKINSEKNTIEKRKRAESLYKEAHSLKGKALYENASSAVREAQRIFEEIEDWSGVSKCVTLTRDINHALQIKAEADTFYTNATQNYHQANFENATYYVKKAQEIYQSINKDSSVKKCDSLLEKIKKGNESKSRANEFFENAQQLHQRGTFTKSNEYAQRAQEIYQRINYSKGVSQCQELISENEKELGKVKKKEELFRNIIISIIVVVVILLAVRWWWEKKKREELKKKREELDKRRREALKRKKEEAEKRKKEARMKKIREEREKVKEALKEEKKKNV